MDPEITIVANAIEIVAIDELKSDLNKVKQHSSDQVASLAGSIREFGWTVPILVDIDNQVIAGEGRRLAGLQLGMERVPCIRANHLSAAQIQSLIVADNRLAEAPWDEAALKVHIENLKDTDADLLGLTGFDFEEIDAILEGGLTEECDDGDPEPKVEFLQCGGHKVELSDAEFIAIKKGLDSWKSSNGGYRGLASAVIRGVGR